MSSKRWKGSQPVEEDIVRALSAFDLDLGLRARVVLTPGLRTETLDISVQSFRGSGSASVGVARYETLWTPGSRSAYGSMLLAIHHVYQTSYSLAHSEDYPHKIKRSK